MKDNIRPPAQHKDLGLDQPITRRDLIFGAGLSALAIAVPGFASIDSVASSAAASSFNPEKDPNYYPPAQHGLRGSHPGSFETAHGHAREGAVWKDIVDLDETYDVIVVGAGISGLAAAYKYLQLSGERARILILDNHDDFGGHAKRIEFEFDGHTCLIPGGSGFMETPFFSTSAKQLIADIGIDVGRLEKGQAKDLRLHAFDMSPSICFDRETYGQSAVIVDDVLPMNKRDRQGNYVLLKHVDAMPLSDRQKSELREFLSTRDDVFKNLSLQEREAALHSMSYNKFVTDYCGLSQSTADAIFTRQPGALIGVTSDGTSLYDALLLPGLPGTHRLGSQGAELQKQIDSMPSLEGHYGPEGNAMISRHLVKRLIPSVTDAETMEQLTTARFDYATLDQPDSRTRIRLNSTVINLEQQGLGSLVAVTYVRGGRAYRVRARHSIYAGFHMYLPYLCPKLPDEQKAALSANVKMPFVAANVCIRNAKAIKELGSASFYFPGRFLHECLVWGRSLGAHVQELDAKQPATIYMIGPVVEPHSGMSPSAQYRLGRQKLLSMSFHDYEKEVREQLVSLFAGTSFDVRRDIVGLTINRWPHGYTRQYNTLFDPDYEDGRYPHEIARRRFGNIAIANADASYVALCNTAIDEGLRAASELLG